jgi:lysozyme
MENYSKLLKQVQRHEGCELKPYRDTEGVLTIGYGRNLEDVGITKGEAETLLLNDLAIAVQEAKTFDWYAGLSEPRKQVIVNMIFNLGRPRFSKFVNTIQFIKDEMFDQASEEMLNSVWAHQVGSRAIELSRQMATDEFQEG